MLIRKTVCKLYFRITAISGGGISDTVVTTDIRPPEKVMMELTEGLARAGQAEWKEKSLLGGGNGPCKAWCLEGDERRVPPS